MLRLIGVTQQYGVGATAVSALSGVDFEVQPGELVAVMGASGSGKSTLLTIAGGLAMPTTGEVVIEGAYLSEQSPRSSPGCGGGRWASSSRTSTSSRRSPRSRT